MSNSNYSSVVSVLHVSDHAKAVEWYSRWLGREPDLTPDEGVAEWKIAENAWIQVAAAPSPDIAGKGTIVCGVHDLDKQRSTCEGTGVPLGETQDYGFIKLASLTDPSGNTVMFVQEVAQE